MNITGHCHCGELVFTAKVLPEKVVICHCTDCQLLSASAFRTVVMSEVDGMNFIKGTPKEYIKIAESGNQRAQGFCQQCGSAMYATSVGDKSRVYGIRLGVVDQRNELTPVMQIWHRSAQPWLNTLHGISTFSTTP
ncbi:GFA family protein [Shewanella sp. 1_MG-2023]|uniref:GFA family protein n=1 Tax=Shewanella electrodiphila TaxID=934143 RepID=A0ABT0KKW9_9GAMM|nr:MULTISPECIES: GFA family protein [Shewanella]MCL1044378.1 GFA family protein [Shewanella electrodiphila]MDO6611748.1 GFA family protein [Shewanella sp. 7_MG-2023]MDO6771603.1 GFA family protein [Shewanella sp. 2_MG-2023]MDO6793748.1 GFA family protein [Shewanella sp. 1_MG-2023]